MTFLIVPFRAGPGAEERQAQKDVFVPYMKGFVADATVIVAEQSRGKLFNRGAVLNAAVHYIICTFGYYPEHTLLFHDVDLLPEHDLRYAYEERTDDIIHIASVWRDRYDSSSYLGGALRMPLSKFVACGGFPVRFFGWGGEDDELRDRIAAMKFDVRKLSHGTLRDMEGLTLQEKLATLRAKKQKCMNKRELRSEYKALRASQKPTDGLEEAAGIPLRPLRIDRFAHHLMIEL